DGTPCPAIRAEVRDEHGREPGPPGLSVRLTRDPQGGGVRVSLTANPGALSAEGIASITLLNDRGETIRQLPVAWVKPVDRLAPTGPSPEGVSIIHRRRALPVRACDTSLASPSQHGRTESRPSCGCSQGCTRHAGGASLWP